MLMGQKGKSTGIDATLLFLTSEAYGDIEYWRSWCTWCSSGLLNLPIVQCDKCETKLFVWSCNYGTFADFNFEIYFVLLSMQYTIRTYGTENHNVLIEILTTPDEQRLWCRMDAEAIEATPEKVGQLLEDIQVGLAQHFETEHLQSLAAAEYDAFEVIKAGTFKQFQNAGLPKAKAHLIINACRSDLGTLSPCHCTLEKPFGWKSNSYLALLHAPLAVSASPLSKPQKN